MKLLCAVVAFATVACSPQAPKSAEPPAQPAPSTEKLDPFVVMVDAERWGVIMDKAMDGAIQADVPSAGVDLSELYRADKALKSGAASLIELRNQVCGQGLVTGAACDLKDWPAWTREPPTGDTPIEELDRRSQWLGATMAPFTDAGCEAGRKATGEELFCSVE
jgi:hypothetical protein